MNVIGSKNEYLNKFIKSNTAAENLMADDYLNINQYIADMAVNTRNKGRLSTQSIAKDASVIDKDSMNCNIDLYNYKQNPKPEEYVDEEYRPSIISQFNSVDLLRKSLFKENYKKMLLGIEFSNN